MEPINFIPFWGPSSMSEQPQLRSVGEPAVGYNDLKYYFANLNTLFSIRGTLATDMMTAMPAGAVERRLHDIAAITKRIYAETTSNAVTKLLAQVEEEYRANPDKMDAWNAANLAEMRRIHSHLSALPPELYLASVQIANEGRKRHSEALKGQSWNEIQTHITQVVDLYRHMADLKQKAFNTKTRYEALLLGYGSDITESQMDALYDKLLEPLKELRDAALAKQNEKPAPLPLEGDFSRGDQMWLNKTILEMMGFDFSRGTLQVTGLAPMAGGTVDDARILVRCGDSSETFLDSLEDTLYQGARGLYIQNLPADWSTQPVGQDLGNLMMNAQSILYETIIGRTPQFFDFIAVRAEGVFRQFKNKSFEPENLYRLRKVITPSAVRNDADELTKIFHDVMRYRIEKDLINGTLSVSELPERWNQDCQTYLNITPQSDIEGPLQNPDWFTGRFGFIPTNTLSHILAATLHDRIYAKMPNLSEMMQYGDMKPINDWLKDKIHSKGRSIECLELMRNITGTELSVQPLLDHLERRYLSDKR
jgi:carboxypeptidase Taq